jgi:diphthamide synthase (EF-2-diphthine--ammonia ligase)
MNVLQARYPQGTSRSKRFGGEFETLVTDGPHMDRAIELEYETEWDGTRGTLRITVAWLSE